MRKYVFFLLGMITLCGCIGERSGQSKVRDREFPIMAWMGVPESETTVERFLELKETGININFSVYSNIEAVKKALDVAEQAGVKLMFSCPELNTDPEKTVKQLMDYPALAGYHLVDEPGAGAFPMLAEWAKRIQSVDREHPCYINLFPNYAPPEALIGEENASIPKDDVYAKYVEMFLVEVPVPFISFDYYPIVEENGVRVLRSSWYKNLETVADASQRFSRHFWAFALSIAHSPYPIPTVGELRLQMFSNLAYGAQTLQYFTYWHPGNNTPWDFHDSPINLDGSRTVVYDRIQTVNKEIHALSHVFRGAELVSVWHTGSQLPEGTRPVDQLPKEIKKLDTGVGGAVVSVLKNRQRYYLVVVNRDFKSSMTLSIEIDKTVKRVQKNGTICSVEGSAETVEIEPGDVVIYTWRK